MNPSLRSRILAGAVLWTIGLFVAAVGVATVVLMRHRHYAIILHGTASSHDVLVALLVLGCMAAGFVLVRRALAPLEALRQRLAAVRAGGEPRIRGTYPSEVQPVVDELNALLDHREQAVRRAVGKAGDLAHGLKTPLAILSQEADRARAGGHSGLAEAITEQVERMRQQIEYHLAHTRAAASGAAPGARTGLADSVAGLVRTMDRLHAERRLSLEATVAAADWVKVQREDLDEMLGNLLDNACKWAGTSVRITTVTEPGALVIRVDDDGPGLEPTKWELVLRRGVRADERAPGSGFGLAIVRDLAELYGGSIALDRSPLGGLRASLRLPA